MLNYAAYWQFFSADKGIATLDVVKNKLKTPKAVFMISEKINCRSWSLSAQDKRNVLDRVLNAHMTLQDFSTSPPKLNKIYFFKRRRARSIFKKRMKTYISCQVISPTTLLEWVDTLTMLRNLLGTVRTNYKLPLGFFFKKSRNHIRFVAINPTVLLNYLRAEPISPKPQIFSGFLSPLPNSLFTTDWLWNRLNEAP